MNYGEEIAYWYLRLNGFFPISNFVIHRSTQIRHSSDCDILAIRAPHVYEEIGGTQDDWDPDLVQRLDMIQRAVGIICEVKTGRYDLGTVFRDEYVRYAVGRLGLLPVTDIDAVVDLLTGDGIVEWHGLYICKFLIADGDVLDGPFLFKTLESVETFIEDRVRAYPKEKYADRIYFGSELFQHTIHRIHCEQERRTRDG